MAIAMNRPTPKRDAIERLSAGLTLANQILDIKGKVDAGDRADEKQTMEQDEIASNKAVKESALAQAAAVQDRATKGILTRGEIVKELGIEKFEPATAKDKGAFKLLVQTENGPVEEYYKPRAKEESKLGQMIKGMTVQKMTADIAAEKLPKQNQAQAALFATRAKSAVDALSGLEAFGFDASSVESGVQSFSLYPERLKGQDFKKFENAKTNFITAVLRKESGASISPTEKEEAAKIYFPQAGDSDEVKAQKLANRNDAIAGLTSEAGEGAMSRVKNNVAGIEAEPIAKATSGINKASAVDNVVAEAAKTFDPDAVRKELIRRKGIGAR